MSRTKWSTPSPSNAPMVEALDQVKSVVEPAFDSVATILQATKELLKITKALLLDLTDPSKLGLKAFLDAIRAVLDELSGESGTGVFFIPIPIIPIDKELADSIVYPDPDKDSMVPADALEVALKEGRIGGGGNYGFLQTLQASMGDSQDPMRPQLDNDAHVAGAIFMFGTESYLKLLSLVYKLAQLFSDKDKPSGVSEALSGGIDIPRPKNLRAELVTSPRTNAVREALKNELRGDTDTPLAVRLTWDLEDKIHVTPWPTVDALGRVTIELEEVVVYRSEQPITTTLSLTQRQKLAIARYPFNSWESEFYDESILKGTSYYYAVGYKAVEQDPEDSSKTFDTIGDDPLTISTVQATVPEDPNMFSRKGTPPDWFMFPSPLALIPAITNTVRKVEAVVDEIEKTLDEKSAKTQKYIEGVDAVIQHYVRLVEDVVNTIEQFVDALNWTGVYAGVSGFAGKGGNARVITEIGNALFDSSDPNRPPFDLGTEAVCGFVIMAGSETYGKLQAFISIISLLFGVQIDQIEGAVDAAVNVWEAAEESIDAAAAEIRERICLADNMSSLIDCPEDEEAAHTFSANMRSDSDGDTSCTGN